MDGPMIQRLYFSTSEVCAITKIKPHVLKKWEMIFPDFKPSKSRSGRKLYKPSDLEYILKIKRFKDDGYTDEKIISLMSRSPAKMPQITKKKEIPPVKSDISNIKRSFLVTEIYSGLKEILRIIEQNDTV